MPERPITRRVDTLEFHSARWAMRRMEVDVSFPILLAKTRDEPPSRCLVPVAFLPKDPVASDLEVRNAEGAVVSLPTRAECMTMTVEAIDELAHYGPKHLPGPPEGYQLDSESRLLVGDVIRGEPLNARILRMELEQKRLPASGRLRDWLLPLLRRLEDTYLLWAPIEDSSLPEHHLTICRSEVRSLNPILPKRRRKPQTVTVPSSVGPIKGHWRPPYWLRSFDLPAAVGELLVTFGLMPIKLERDELEARRFRSYHLRLEPPKGLLVREVRAGGISEEEWDALKPKIHELESRRDQAIQGEDSQTGHVHLAMDPNPGRLNARVTIGLRPGTTTLWALVSVVTCALLVAFHSNFAYLVQVLYEHKPAPGKADYNPISLEVVTAVLLVGPSFAAAWALRERDPTLMRSMLAGTRLLLLSSAALSVATALALGGLQPFGWERCEAVDWYASLSFTVAVLVLIGWVQARWLIWVVYRKVLKRPELNLLATIALALISYGAVRKLADVPLASTLVLFVAGFGFTAVAGNRSSVKLGQVSRLPAALAGLAALLTLALASRELHLYNRLMDRGEAHHWGGKVELLVALVAGILLVYRNFTGGESVDSTGADAGNSLQTGKVQPSGT